jgi:hypothetical protein
VAGERQHPRTALDYVPHRLQAAERALVELPVQQDHVGLVEPPQLLDARRLLHQLEPRRGAHHVRQAQPHHGVVVDDRHADGRPGLSHAR